MFLLRLLAKGSQSHTWIFDCAGVSAPNPCIIERSAVYTFKTYVLKAARIPCLVTMKMPHVICCCDFKEGSRVRYCTKGNGFTKKFCVPLLTNISFRYLIFS